jgi:hypothetical protein
MGRKGWKLVKYGQVNNLYTLKIELDLEGWEIAYHIENGKSIQDKKNFEVCLSIIFGHKRSWTKYMKHRIRSKARGKSWG